MTDTETKPTKGLFLQDGVWRTRKEIMVRARYGNDEGATRRAIEAVKGRMAREGTMNTRELKLLDAHEREAERKDADFTNLGWYVGPERIESKTTKGILVTKTNGKVIFHEWHL